MTLAPDVVPEITPDEHALADQLSGVRIKFWQEQHDGGASEQATVISLLTALGTEVGHVLASLSNVALRRALAVKICAGSIEVADKVRAEFEQQAAQ
jgi:hypothetical protein